MRQIRVAKRHPGPASWPQRHCPPTRATLTLSAPIKSPAAPAIPAPGSRQAAGRATCPAARGRPRTRPAD